MSIWNTDHGPYIGYGTKTLEGPPQLGSALQYNGARHIVLLGGTGSGKSRRFIVPNLALLQNWSMLVVDIKGELACMTAAHRAATGSDVILLNPFNLYGMGSLGYNPIASLKLDDTFPDYARALAMALIRIEGKEPHFAQSAQDFVTAVIMWVRLMIPGGSMEDVRALLGLDDTAMQAFVGSNDFRHKGKSYLGLVQAGIMHDWEEIGIKAGRFMDINPDNKEMHAVLSTALTQTSWMDSRPIKRDLAGPEFDFSVMKRRPTTVYLMLPVEWLSTHSTWLRLMIASVMKDMMRSDGRPDVPTLLVLDEFFAIAEGDGLPIISKNQAVIRNFGIKLLTVLQDLAQADILYGQRGFESFIANAGVLQAFATQDMLTTDYLSRRSGTTTRSVSSDGSSYSYQTGAAPSFSESVNRSIIQLPNLLGQEIMGMDEGRTVIFSHHLKGTTIAHLPFPSELPFLKHIAALDPD